MSLDINKHINSRKKKQLRVSQIFSANQHFFEAVIFDASLKINLLFHITKWLPPLNHNLYLQRHCKSQK